MLWEVRVDAVLSAQGDNRGQPWASRKLACLSTVQRAEVNRAYQVRCGMLWEIVAVLRCTPAPV